MKSIKLLLILLFFINSCVKADRDNPIDIKAKNYNSEIGKVPTPDRWLTKKSMAVPREDLATAQINGKIYAFGGTIDKASSTVTDSVEEYNTVTDIWAMKSPMPVKRTKHTSVTVNGKVYIIGGSSGTSTLSRVDEYDPFTDSWNLKTDFLPSESHSAVEFNGKIYVIGGINFGTIRSSVQLYDPVTDIWSNKADMPTARSHVTLSVINDKIYAIGGYENSGTSKKIEIYTPATDTWVALANYSLNLTMEKAAPVNGKIYSLISITKEVEEYDFITGQWSSQTNMLTGRTNFSVTEVNGKIYVIGGNIGSFLTGKVEEYTPPAAGINKNAWSTKTSMITKRAVAGVVDINGKIYVFGGWDSYTNPLSTVIQYSLEVYDPISDSWTYKSNLTYSGAGWATAVINGKIYALSWGAFYVYDPKTDLWTGIGPHPGNVNINWFSGVSFNGKMYIIGGWDGNTSTVYDTLNEYDPVYSILVNKTPMPTARFAHSSTVFNGKIYIMGGRGAGGADLFDVVEVYDPLTDTWETKNKMPEARGFHTAAAVNGKIYIIGGLTNASWETFYTNTVLEYDPVSDTWKTMTSMNHLGGFFSSNTAVVNGRIYVIGGETWSDPQKSSHMTTNIVEEYIPPNY